ncbi:protein trichome birefringence-like 14 isoform X2 [Triticum urartu]|uniref:Trichome birefringence-like N-terminal domain-containing protein n=1 Tax=Triticum urartu TaxID=4572 RepID=A0A8R7PN43_TRIUA|nr:protein trichome birefringence-like 14 isoform X2 [Triticum urartu]
MRLRSINGLRCKQLKLVLLAFFIMFILWKWEEGTYYNTEDIHPDSLVVSHPDQRTSSDEDFPSVDSLPQPVVKVGKQVTGAPPPVPLVGVPANVGGEQGASPSKSKECNHRNGRWVPDKRRPLYSGFGCKQWLSESWSCRLTQRTDFDYEQFRWQPEACDMPEFEASQFLMRMQGKTIAYVGDSLGRQMFQSMMCMATAGEERADVEDVGAEYGFVLAPGAKRPDGWAYRFPSTNTTILYHWSSTLCDLEPLNPSDPATSYAMHLDRPPAFVRDNLHRIHVLVLNTGHHWNRGKLRANKWEMYVGGSPNRNKNIAAIWKAKNFTIHSVVKWLDAQLPRHPHLKAFYRSISPRHFFNGDWDTGGRCDSMSPLAKGSGISLNRSEDTDAEGAVMGTRVRLLDVTALSRLRDEGHISRYSIKATQGIQDCLHWCLPGVPDTWNEILAAQLL